MARILFLSGLLLATMQSGQANTVTNGPWILSSGQEAEGPATYEKLLDPGDRFNPNVVKLVGYLNSAPGGTVTVPATIGVLPVRVLGTTPSFVDITTDRLTVWQEWRRYHGLFYGARPGAPVTAVVIPNSVRRIEGYTFVDATNLVSVTIPTSVTHLGGGAFWGCSKLANIVIPNSVPVINHATFAGCRSLTNVSIPSSVTGIGERAFAGCSNLPSITIPVSVASLGDEAFTLCGRLTNVVIPGSVRSVGSRAFASCSGLTNVTVSSGVAWIGNEAFVGCSKLASVTIPASVTSLGNEVFSGCKALTSVYFQGDAPSAGVALFKGISPVGKVFYPAGAKGWGSSFGGWPTQVYTPPAAPAPTPSVSNTNLSSSRSSAILAGELNLVDSDATNSVIVGGLLNTIRSKSVAASIVGGNANTAGGFYSSIGGGQLNFALANLSAVNGGQGNFVTNSSTGSVIAGGISNKITGTDLPMMTPGIAFETAASIGGGFNNKATGRYATVSGGNGNLADQYSSVGGGQENEASRGYATVAGGERNKAIGDFATIPGGRLNAATTNAFAAGTRAQATNTGAFVWADGQDNDFGSTNDNSFSVRAAGGVRFTTAAAFANQTVSWTPGSGTWSFTSDAATKEAFRTVDARDVLRRVAALPVKEWNYIGYRGQRHIGPTAQDWHAAFPLNESDTTLNTADLHGVSLAAIKGLVEELKERDKTIEQLKSKLRAVEEHLNSLPPSP